jgi:signal transduction histidine kinase
VLRITPPLETGVQLAYTVVSITGVAVALEAAFWWRLGHGGTPWRSFGESLLVATLVLVPAYLLSYPLLPWVPALEEPGAPRDPVYYVVTAMGDAIPVMLVVAAVFLYPRALERAAVREAEVAALRREAEILRLRASLEPHFVLNTLNTIAGLVGESPGEARSLLGALGDLFRDAVTNGDVSHPLSHEVAWLERYAALLRARYDGQVDLAFEIAPEARAWRVPRLVLQPLVENAVEHGVLAREGGISVTVRARVEGARLVLEVRDPGPGFRTPIRSGARGMKIAERRVALEGGDPRLETAREGEETVVRVRLGAAESSA